MLVPLIWLHLFLTLKSGLLHNEAKSTSVLSYQAPCQLPATWQTSPSPSANKFCCRIYFSLRWISSHSSASSATVTCWLGSMSSFFHLRETLIWDVRNSGSMVPGVPYSSHILSLHVCTWIYSYTWVLFCCSRTHLRKLFPSWHKWILKTLEFFIRADLCMARPESLLHHIPAFLLNAKATRVLVHLKVRISNLNRSWQFLMRSSGQIKPIIYYKVVFKTFETSQFKKAKI